MLSTIYISVIQAGAIIGAIRGCYNGCKIVDANAPTSYELFEDGETTLASATAFLGCIIGMGEGVIIGALSPFLGTGLLIKMAHDNGIMMLRHYLKEARERQYARE